MYTVNVKSGTNGHYDYDNCDLRLAEVPSNNIPRVGDILNLVPDGKEFPSDYLVREVKFVLVNGGQHRDFGEYIKVYVINI